MSDKLVSVIVPVYNALPYFGQTVDSLLTQTCDLTSVEFIFVDDGSTDGSEKLIDELAETLPGLVRAKHLPPSGGPAHPRNVGIEMAQSEYVFFLDADDFLGVEALERMIAHVREWDSDILVVKQVGEGGRRAPQSMFRMSQPEADVWTSRVFNTLSPLKLFRLSLLRDNGIRFPEQYRHREDHPFVAEALFCAKKVSVAADYDYCHIVQRDDGANITSEVYVDFDENHEMLKTMLSLVDRYEPNPHDADAIVFPRILKSSWFAGLYAAAVGDANLRDKRLASMWELVSERYTQSTALNRIPNGMKELAGFIGNSEYDEACAVISLLKVTPDSEFGGIELDAGSMRVTDGKLLLEDSKGIVLLDATSAITVSDIVESCVIANGMHVCCSCEQSRFWSEQVALSLRVNARKADELFNIPAEHVRLRSDERIYFEFDLGREFFEQLESSANRLWDLSLVLQEGGIERSVRLGGRMSDECTKSLKVPATLWKRSDGLIFQLRRTPAGNFAIRLARNKTNK